MLLGFKKALLNAEDKKIFSRIKVIIGKSPKNLELYKLSLNHASMSKNSKMKIRQSNERLEFLGDAVLSTIVAEYLFKKYPFKDEGFLTEIRSRIVNRESLNNLGRKIGLSEIIKVQGSKKSPHSHKSIHGNALEALIGAIYLDLGPKATGKFIVSRLLMPFINLEDLIHNKINHKSALIEWAQKEGKNIDFKIIHEEGDNHNKEFTAQIFIDDTPQETGMGLSKKRAEQIAAEKTYLKLDI